MKKNSYRHHFSTTTKLALPVVIGQAGHMVAQIADNMMVGHVSAIHLAASSFANTVFILFLLLGIGISTGLTPLIGESFGSSNCKNCRSLLKHGLIINGVISVALTFVMVVLVKFFHLFGQDPEVVRLSQTYFMYLAFSMLPYMLFTTLKQFAEGMEMTKFGMKFMLTGNALNIALNYLFIYGNFNFPRMELDGAGLATLLSRVYMLFHIWFVMRSHKTLSVYVKNFNLRKYSTDSFKRILKIGIPIGLQFIIEVGAFSIGAILVGQTGSKQLAAHQIVISIASLTYLMASGIGSAATIRISNFMGKSETGLMRQAGLTAFAMAAVFMIFSALMLYLGRNLIPTWYVSDAEVITGAASLFLVAAFFQFSDGIQVVGLGALRGIHDVKIPTVIATIAYWFMALPVSYYLGITLGMGAKGVWYGYLVGLSAAAILLFGRFMYMLRLK